MQADSRRIMLAVRQPAFLMHVADTLGADAERACTLLVQHGRLTFNQLAQAYAAAAGGGSESLRSECAALVVRLMGARLLEQVLSCSPASLPFPARLLTQMCCVGVLRAWHSNHARVRLWVPQRRMMCSVLFCSKVGKQ
jgi:hypothetical protein